MEPAILHRYRTKLDNAEKQRQPVSRGKNRDRQKHHNFIFQSRTLQKPVVAEKRFQNQSYDYRHESDKKPEIICHENQRPKESAQNIPADIFLFPVFYILDKIQPPGYKKGRGDMLVIHPVQMNVAEKDR